MKVLVTGATGFIGRRVVARLVSKGHEVVFLTRSAQKAVENLAFPAKPYAWRPTEELPPEAALAGVEGILNLAGEGIADRRWSETQKKRILDSRVLGTRHLNQAISRYGKSVKTVISASAIGFYGDRGSEKLTESSSPGRGFLAEVCEAWEKESRQVPAGVRWAQIRIGIVLGPDGGALKKMLPPFRLGLGGPIGNGQQGMSWIHVDDVADLFVFALETPSVTGVLNGTAPQPVSNKEFSQALGKALNRPALLPAPSLALKLAMGEMSELVLNSDYVYPERTLQNGFTFKHPDLAASLLDVCKKKTLN